MKNNVFTSLIAVGLTLFSTFSLASGDPTNGKAISDAKCVACHGEDGNSPSSAFPKIAGLGEKYILKQLVDIQNKTREVPEMLGLLDEHSAQELSDLAAYFAAQKMQLAGAMNAELMLNSGEKVQALDLGEALYRGGNLETNVPACTGCHSPRGLGNAPASYPRLSGQYAEYIEKQLLAFRAGTRANDGESRVMRSVAEHMSDVEIKAVASYIAGLH